MWRCQQLLCSHLHNVALLHVHVNLDRIAVVVELCALPWLATTQVCLATIVCDNCGCCWADPAGCEATAGPQAAAGAQERALHVAVLLLCADSMSGLAPAGRCCCSRRC
jgi:hypothetical protein